MTDEEIILVIGQLGHLIDKAKEILEVTTPTELREYYTKLISACEKTIELVYERGKDV